MIQTKPASFFVPVIRPNDCLMNAIEQYTWFGGKVVEVVVLPSGETFAFEREKSSSSLSVALKVTSMILSLGVFLILALAIKAIYRCLNDSVVVPADPEMSKHIAQMRHDFRLYNELCFKIADSVASRNNGKVATEFPPAPDIAMVEDYFQMQKKLDDAQKKSSVPRHYFKGFSCERKAHRDALAKSIPNYFFHYDTFLTSAILKIKSRNLGPVAVFAPQPLSPFPPIASRLNPDEIMRRTQTNPVVTIEDPEVSKLRNDIIGFNSISKMVVDIVASRHNTKTFPTPSDYSTGAVYQRLLESIIKKQASLKIPTSKYIDLNVKRSEYKASIAATIPGFDKLFRDFLKAANTKEVQTKTTSHSSSQNQSSISPRVVATPNLGVNVNAVQPKTTSRPSVQTQSSSFPLVAATSNSAAVISFKANIVTNMPALQTNQPAKKVAPPLSRYRPINPR